MRGFSITPLAVLVLVAAGSTGCLWGGDHEPDYAEPRAYAGLLLETYEDDGETVRYVSLVQEGHPADEGGVLQDDLLVSLDGEPVTTVEEFYGRLEERSPGDVIALGLERFVAPFPGNGSPPATEDVGVDVTLVEEPLPDSIYLRVPYSTLREADELRLGIRLAEITRPLAEHFSLDSPEGVLVAWEPLPFSISAKAGVQAGDVIASVNDERVDYLSELQEAIDDANEDEALAVTIIRKGQELQLSLDELGPDVPGANQFPADTRRRLQAGLERGDLHPRNLEVSIRQYFWRSDPEPAQPTLRIGAITALSPDSITIEVYSTGGEWSLAVGPDVMLWPSDRSLADFHVGEFVQVHTQDGDTAFWVRSLAEPLGER